MLEGIWGGGALQTEAPKNLGLGADTKKIGGTVKAAIKSKMTLPSVANTSTLMRESKETGRIDAQFNQAKEIYDNRVSQTNKLVQEHQLHVNYSKHMMGVDHKLREMESAHAVNVADHQINAAQTVQYISGYVKQMQIANNVIDI